MQLSDALAHVSTLDFPERWPTLLPELVAKLATNDVAVISGVLDTANRWGLSVLTNLRLECVICTHVLYFVCAAAVQPNDNPRAVCCCALQHL